MADLAVVALGLDATGMTSGAAQANRALTSVEKEMSQAEKQSQQLGGAFQKVGTSAQGFNASITKSTQALSGMGGPIGQVSGQLGGMSSQLEGLVGSFGLVGGAAVGALAGIVALGSAIVNLTIQGSKLSDGMGDIAEGTGLTIDQVQRLSAAFSLAGEDVSSAERAFRQFQGLIQEAIDDPSSKAAQTIYRLGVSAKEAGKDMGGAFINTIARLKDIRATTEGAVASNEAFGRGIGALVRSSQSLQEVLNGNRDALEAAGIIATEEAIQKGQKLDDTINRLSNTWNVFTQNLAASSEGGFFISLLDGFNERLKETNSLLAAAAISAGQLFIGRPGAGGQRAGQPVQDPDNVAFGPFAPFVGERLTPPPGRAGRGGGRGGGRRDTSPNLPTSFDPIVSRGVQRAFDLINAMNDANAAAAKAARELPVVIDTVADLFERLGKPFLAGVPPGGAGTITGGAIPGVPNVGILAPSQITSARQARIEDALGGIFEDFVFQITTARSTVGDAFKGLLLGITDTFAAEFAKSVQESLQTSFIRPLASWLEDALKGIFEGIDLKGVSKFFLTLGKSFVGAFAEGGTIPSGHWGLVGERGPEIAFAGSTPMHIQPMGGGGSVTMNFAISTASGEVSQRTQDQIADAAARGIERAQRLRGAR